MLRLFTFILMFALAVTNGAAVAAAMCQHQNAVAHAAALQSSDAHVAAEAETEEAAARAASKEGSLTDGAAAVAGYILPEEASPVPPRIGAASMRHDGSAAGLASRALRPLLEPPSA